MVGLTRSPPVITEEEWTNLTIEIDLITQDRSNLPYMWLSATEGDKDEELARRNETDLVKNETKKLEAGASQISAFNLVHIKYCAWMDQSQSTNVGCHLPINFVLNCDKSVLHRFAFFITSMYVQLCFD